MNPINLECASRILDKVSDNAQKNLTANFVVGNLTTEDQQSYKDGLAWIYAMQVAARALTTANDPDYRLDEKWPECPANAAELATRY